MKKILSLDGGGIRGLIPALVLDAIEKATGHRAAEKFGIDAGNGFVTYAGAPLTSVPWVTIRVQRFSKRQDFAGREWQSRYEQCLAAAVNARAHGQDYAQADQLLYESNILLGSDGDFTLNDRMDLSRQHSEALSGIKKAMQASSGGMKGPRPAISPDTMASVLQQAQVAPVALSPRAPATGDAITVAPFASAEKVVSTQKLMEILQERLNQEHK